MAEKSGLLLVTGPFALNSCLVRRVSQNYVIATKTRVDLRKVNIPKHINDGHFHHAKENQPHREGHLQKVRAVEAAQGRPEERRRGGPEGHQGTPRSQGDLPVPQTMFSLSSSCAAPV
ncbi:hypothetical protein pipiens_018465 [Culex pipiens pipiens]|uniref:60S ribosomal protein L6 n=1 Tax=Culex pipiens pipiens TaxID=38569 RepID=A0ABD1CBJ8_CULPP